jgi:cobalt/nickel transport system permease protein
VVAASALFCVEFGLSHDSGEFDLSKLFAVMTSFHSLVGVGESLITGGVVSYLVAVRPDLIPEPNSQPGAVAGLSRVVWSGAIAALAVAAFVAPFASEGADALEATAAKMNFVELERVPRPLLLADYEVPLPAVDASSGFWQKLSVSLAGVLGTSAVLGMTLIFGRVSQSRVTARLAAREAGTSHAG